MPRKRKTRTPQARPKPKVPEGDEGADLEKNLKAEKLKTLLADFDSEMASFWKSIREDVKDYEKNIECAYSMTLAKIPKSIREHDLDEFISQTNQSQKEDAQIAEELNLSLGTDMELMALTKTKKLTKTKGKTKKKSSTDQTESATVKKANPRRKKPIVSATATNVENMPPPSTARRSTRTSKKGVFETPAGRGGPSAAGWETPLITPKFDPRLPMTPAMARRPKQGEVYLSLAGSPVAGDGRRTLTATAKKENLSRLMVDNTEIDLDNLEIPDFEQSTKDYLRRLKEKLNALPLSPANTT